MDFLWIVFQTLLLVLALALDGFVCSLSYGANKIKIPMKSITMIAVITTALLGIGVIFAQFLSGFLPEGLLDWLPFIILFILGTSKIFDGAIKSLIRKRGVDKHFEFSLFSLGFILKVFATYEEADADHSKYLSLKEAIPLAVALGLDGLGVGFSIGFMAPNLLLLLGLAFIVKFLCVHGGAVIGHTLAKKVSFDLSILSGLILVAIAFYELFG